MSDILRDRLVIVLAALLLFVPGLGAVHLFDWDEINFAEMAREMVVTGDVLRPQIDFKPFHEKPPLFIWLQAACMAVFGVGEFAARLPNAVCGAITLLVIHGMGTRLRGPLFGRLWALAYVGSILPHLYFRSGIIDPWFNLFIFLGLDRIIRVFDGAGGGDAVWGGLFLGLAVLTKGPVGILIPGLTVGVMLLLSRLRLRLPMVPLVRMALALVVTIGSWAAIDLLRNGPTFMQAFFWRQVAMLTTEDAGHGGFFGYHVVVLLVGCFPASLFALHEGLRPSPPDDPQRLHRRWMVVLLLVVLVLFSIVKTKIVHYSSLCYFPLTYLAAVRLAHIWEHRVPFGPSRFALGAFGSLIAAVVIAVPFLGMRPDLLRPLLSSDPFALGNLEAVVPWTGWEALAGVLLAAGLLAAHFLHGATRYRTSIVVLFTGGALFVTTTLVAFISNIEAYSQRAAIDFFTARQGERCHLATKDYKSYAPWFYGRTTGPTPPEEVLFHGPIDRPVYLSCKVTSVEAVQALGTFTEIGRSNGFVFFRRDP
ncbi:MAG: glycosyltransferase family 39 protein [Flavobacteriales bacterium]|nr:glycosyltransferase family 39 protein [Flavobacteriales bacterium]